MTEVLKFPGLGIQFNINRVAFSFGPFTVYWYGIMIATGLVLAVLYANKRASEFGINKDKLMDIILIGTIGSIIGARAYFVAFSWDKYKDDLLSIFKIWEGGIAIYGAIIGALLFGLIAAKKKGVKCLALTDLALPCFLLGQGIGRWGNFFNIEAFGSNTTLPWGMTSDGIVMYLQRHQAELAEIGVTVDPNMPVHPTFLYESIWCLIGFVIIAFYAKHRKFDGELTLLYAIWYGAERFIVEGLRTDSLMWGKVRVSQALALVTVIISLGIYIYIIYNSKKKGISLMPYGHTPEGAKENLAKVNENNTDSQNEIAESLETKETEEIISMGNDTEDETEKNVGDEEQK